jgi:hypothetical protein
MPQYFSRRGFPLAYYREVRQQPVLTVENYCKWYELYLLVPDPRSPHGVRVEIVEFPHDNYCDHVPYPAAVRDLADENDWYVCTESMEMMIGRYMLEYLNCSEFHFDSGAEELRKFL